MHIHRHTISHFYVSPIQFPNLPGIFDLPAEAVAAEMVHPVAEADDRSPFGQLTKEEFYERHGVSHDSSYFINPRGFRIFTQWWIPLSQSSPVIGTVSVVHGFSRDSSCFEQLTAIHIAKAGFAVCALDHQGHGFSEGLVAHIPDIVPIVDDCISFFDSFRERFPPSLPSFLYSESLGGAIALLIHLRSPALSRPWDGAILSGAMCGISAKFKPPWPLEHLLWVAAAVIPTWKVVPTRGSLPDISFKVEWKRRLAFASSPHPLARPRAATAQELLRVCQELQGRFEEITMPLLIVHGGDDVVCDPACATDLQRRAASQDKTLKIYPGMWHMLIGEAEEDVELVFGDIIDWLRTRAERGAAAAAEQIVAGTAGP